MVSAKLTEEDLFNTTTLICSADNPPVYLHFSEDENGRVCWKTGKTKEVKKMNSKLEVYCLVIKLTTSKDIGIPKIAEIHFNWTRSRPRWYYGYKNERSSTGYRQHTTCPADGFKTKRLAEKAMVGK